MQCVQEDQHLIYLFEVGDQWISDSLQQQQLPAKRTGVQNTELGVFKEEKLFFFFLEEYITTALKE